MSVRLKVLIGAGLLACGLTGTASALPLAALQDRNVSATNIEAARLICPRFRPCYRVYGGGFYRPYAYARPYGYGRGYGYGYRRPFYRGYGY